MNSPTGGSQRILRPAGPLVLALLLAAIIAACVVAPTELSMGHSQRIVYVHVSLAWIALAGFPYMALAGFLYLRTRRLAWDDWARAAGEMSWLCCSLTLITGSIWARAAWGSWWTWDPRLTTAFVLWVLYSGHAIVGRALEDVHQRARIGAVLAIIGALEVPLVLLATRLFRGMHPKSPEAEPIMVLALAVSATGFAAFLIYLMVSRRDQFAAHRRLDRIEDQLDASPSSFHQR